MNVCSRKIRHTVCYPVVYQIVSLHQALVVAKDQLFLCGLTEMCFHPFTFVRPCLRRAPRRSGEDISLEIGLHGMPRIHGSFNGLQVPEDIGMFPYLVFSHSDLFQFGFSGVKITHYAVHVDIDYGFVSLDTCSQIVFFHVSSWNLVDIKYAAKAQVGQTCFFKSLVETLVHFSYRHKTLFHIVFTSSPLFVFHESFTTISEASMNFMFRLTPFIELFLRETCQGRNIVLISPVLVERQ